MVSPRAGGGHAGELGAGESPHDLRRRRAAYGRAAGAGRRGPLGCAHPYPPHHHGHGRGRQAAALRQAVPSRHHRAQGHREARAREARARRRVRQAACRRPLPRRLRAHRGGPDVHGLRQRRLHGPAALPSGHDGPRRPRSAGQHEAQGQERPLDGPAPPPGDRPLHGAARLRRGPLRPAPRQR